MAVAAYASDLTDVTNYTPTFGGTWSAGGGGAGGLNVGETDFFIIESECVSKNAFASDDRWLIGPTQSTALPAGDAFFVWATHLVPGAMEVKAGGVGEAGLYVMVGTSSTVYYRYYVGGSDTLIYDDRWLCTPIDHVEALHNSAAGSPGTGNMSNWGVGANMANGGPTKGAPLALGGVRHGRAFTVTAGEAAAYGTFAGAATYNDAGTRRYGQFQSAAGGYKMQGLFEFGTSGTAVDFRDANGSVSIANTEFVEAGFNGFEVNHASSKVLLDGYTFRALGTVSPGYWLNNANADVDLLGCTFIGMGDFDFLAATVATGSLWQNCGQVTPAGADLSGATIEDYEGTANTAALVYNETADPNSDMTGMTFNKGTTATHAIEFGTSAPTTMTLDAATFTGYSSTASPGDNSSALNFLRTSGTTTLNLVNGTTDISSSIKTTGSHTVNVVISPVDVTVTSITPTGVVVPSCRVFLAATADTGTMPVDVTVTIVNSGSTATVTHTSHGLSTGDYVDITGASLVANLGSYEITNTGTNTYTYAIGSTPGSSPTGTIKSTFVFLAGTTHATTGELTMSRSFGANQSVAGWARKSSAADNPKYNQGPIAGTVSSTTGGAFTAVMTESA